MAEDDEEEGFERYTFTLCLSEAIARGVERSSFASQAGRARDKPKTLGTVVLHAAELFDEEGFASWPTILKNLNRKVGFECTGFVFEDRSILTEQEGQTEDRLVFANDAATLDRCLDMVEDEMEEDEALQIFLVPQVEFVMFDQGTNDESGSLKPTMRGLTWEVLRRELRKFCGKDVGFQYQDDSGQQCSVATQEQLDACLTSLFDVSPHNFELEVDIVPLSSLTRVSLAPSAQAGSSIASATHVQSSLHLELVCSIRLPKTTIEAQGLRIAKTVPPDVHSEESSDDDEEEEHGLRESLPVGAVTVTAQDALSTVRSKMKRLRGVPGSMNVLGFSYREEVDRHAELLRMETGRTLSVQERKAVKGGQRRVTVRSEEAWDKCKEEMLTAAKMEGKRKVRLVLGQDGEGEIEDQAEVGARPAAAEVEESGKPSKLVREPLQAFQLLLYEGEREPVRIDVKVDVSWNQLGSRLAKMFGRRVSLAYSLDTEQVATISGEHELRTAVEGVQRLWHLGTHTAALHAAVILPESIPASSVTKESKDAAAAAVQEERKFASVHRAAGRQDAQTLRKVLQSDAAAAHALDANGASALHYACAAADSAGGEAVEVLVSHKAVVNLPDDQQCFPLHCACRSAPSARLLLQQRARLNVRDHVGWTPLHRAAAAGADDVASLLIEFQADIDAASGHGWTALHVAARSGSEAVAAVLVKGRADVLARTQDGQHAVDVLSELAGAEAFAVLREASKDAVSIEHARKREEASDGRSWEVSTLGRLKKILADEGAWEQAGIEKESKGSIFKLFEVYDGDGDGTLSKEEFHAALEAPPIAMRFADRERLHKYMDVDGDGEIDIEEFASALLGRSPPALDNDLLQLTVHSVRLLAPLLVSSSAERHRVFAAVDFLSAHREGRASRAEMAQIGSSSVDAHEGWVPLEHTQRFRVDEKSNARNRSSLVDALVKSEEMLRAEVILFADADADAGPTELAACVLCLAPDRTDAVNVKESRRVQLYRAISTVRELPPSWREYDHADLLTILRRCPLVIQHRVKPGDRGSIPPRANVVEVLSAWEREHAEKEECSQRERSLGQRSVTLPSSSRPSGSLDPVAEAIVTLKALHVLDSLVVDAARAKGLDALSDKWRARWQVS